MSEDDEMKVELEHQKNIINNINEILQCEDSIAGDIKSKDYNNYDNISLSYASPTLPSAVGEFVENNPIL